MSFAASTAPATKQQFVSSKKYGGLKKILTPKTKQWGSTEDLDLNPLKDSKTLKSIRSNKQELSPLKESVSSKSIQTNKPAKFGSSAPNRTKDPPKSIGEQKETYDKKPFSTHSHKHNKEKGKNTGIDNTESVKNNDSEFDNIPGRVVGNNIYISSVKKHKEMLYKQKRYQERIEQLEADLKEVLQFYENVYKENESLKQKLNMDDQLVAEPYKTVLNDRAILRNAESSYKKRIAQLQNEIKNRDKENDRLKEEIKQLKAENSKLYENIKRLIAQITEREKQEDEEAIQDDTFWEKKPNKSEVNWLLKKNLETEKDRHKQKVRIEKKK